MQRAVYSIKLQQRNRFLFLTFLLFDYFFYVRNKKWRLELLINSL